MSTLNRNSFPTSFIRQLFPHVCKYDIATELPHSVGPVVTIYDFILSIVSKTNGDWVHQSHSLDAVNKLLQSLTLVYLSGMELEGDQVTKMYFPGLVKSLVRRDYTS